MIPKPLDQITEADLQGLIGVSENRQLEFKANLGRSDDDTKEFLKDVSAMANVIGGDIIYGIEEGVDENGNTVARAIHGISGQNSDDEILRLDNLIRDCIKPRLIGIGIRPVQLNNRNTVFVIRVPKSWNAPHVVDRRGHWRFYYRDSAGTHPMDITELRHAMIFADTLGQRLEEFHIERLAKVASNTVLEGGPKIVLHFQPLSSVQLDAPIDLARVNIDQRKLMLIGIAGIESELRLNFDGLLAFNPNSPQIGYIQVFRNGVIEAVDTRVLRREGGFITARSFEQAIINTTVRCLGLINDLGLVAPVRFHISLLTVNGYRLRVETGGHGMDTDFYHRQTERYEIDRDDLLLPGLLFTSEDVTQFSSLTIPDRGGTTRRYDEAFRDVGRLLRPLFNIIWNAAGFAGSLYYNSDGVWTGQINYG